MSSLFERKIKKVTTPLNISKYFSDSDYFDATTNVEKIEQFHLDAVRRIFHKEPMKIMNFIKKKWMGQKYFPKTLKF